MNRMIYVRGCISTEGLCKAQSGGVRLPAAVVEALDLKEGDESEISIAAKWDFKVARDRSKERGLLQLREMKWSFPPDFRFDREEVQNAKPTLDPNLVLYAFRCV